jgi:outer membrane receptor protein involved in Fe transport
MQETSGGFVGPTDALGVHNDLNTKQMGLHMGYRWSVGEGGSLAARLGWTQNQIRELLEVFPAGQGAFTSGGTPATLDSGGLLQTSLNSRHLGAELVLQRGLPRGHEIVAGLSVGREATWGLEANANVDFRDLTLLRDPVPGEGVQEVVVEMDPLEGVVEDAERTAVGLFVQDSWRLFSPDVVFTAGVRLDHHSDLGTAASPRLAAVWTLPRSFTLKTLYGRAFRAPSFRELHFYLPGLIGNPDLEATVADTFDASLRYGGENLELSLGLFLSRVQDPILPEAPYSVAAPQRLVNAPGFDTRGVEVEAKANLGAHVAFGSFTALRAEYSETGERVADVPSYQGTLGVTFLFEDRFSLTPTVTLRSSSPRAVGDERNELPGYGLLGLSFHGREVFRDLGIGVTIRNLLDEEYFDPSPLLGVPGDYPRPGRSLLVHAEYRF